MEVEDQTSSGPSEKDLTIPQADVNSRCQRGGPRTRNRRWKAENGVCVLGPPHHSLSCHQRGELGRWRKFKMLRLLLRKPELPKQATYFMEFANWIRFVFFSFSGVMAPPKISKIIEHK